MSDIQDNSWQQAVERSVNDHFDEIREVRRYLHQHPEPSGAEVETTQYLARRLQKFGVKVQFGPENRGLIVDGPAFTTPKVGLRADIDALRIQDQKQTSYCSQVDGLMHACGHDAHSATVYGAMLALIDVEKSGLVDSIPWRVLFQPAEETNEGARQLVEAGAVDGLQALFSLHMDPSRQVGTIGVRTGDFTADCNELEIEVLGRGAHAARPHEACDPIAAVAQLISSIFLFVPRSTDSQEPVVVSFGQINAGQNPNVIPDRVLVRGTLRTLREEVSKNTISHLERLARGVAEASGTSIHVRHHGGPPAVYNDPRLTEILTSSATAILGRENVQEIPKPSMGGEDFANYLCKVKGAMFRLGCASGDSPAPPLHSPLFDIDENALAIGAKILARSVIQWCHEN
ncbi:M20 metallopeptidase family protein [Thalassoglobus sp.]|uniref:M20 metallopeptidase family protein n=1 Tax=Thalassoglobus sp. TaxID=2795869 RepID=UPI003AA979F9